MDGWMNEYMNGWRMDRWMNGWMYECKDGWMNE